MRAVDKNVPIMLHLDNGGNNALYREWLDVYKRQVMMRAIFIFIISWRSVIVKMAQEN